MGVATKARRIIILVLALAFFCVAPNLAPFATGQAAQLTAVSAQSPVWVDGQNISFDAYNIEGNNYFKLRDLAYVLNGGPKSFEISFDSANNAILLTTDRPYTAVGGEMAAKGSSSVTPLPSELRIFLNGREILPAAYNINGNTYFKLRDIAQALDFAVEWDEQSGSVLVDSTKSYGQTVLLTVAEDAVPLTQLPIISESLGGQVLGTPLNESALGTPRRILNGGADTQLRIYGDYSHFTLVCVSGGQVAYIYLNYDNRNTQAGKLFTDNNDGGKVYAVAAGNMPSCDLRTTEQLLFELTNAFRGFHGLGALRWNDTLSQVAGKHSQDMSQQNFFSHQSLDGATTGGRLDKAGYKWTVCAENILAGYQNAFEALDVLVNSAPHRKNLLTTNCDETGVGWVKSEQGKYGYYGTQVFGKL